ncbi:MAG: extracellular solute-binding protein [Brevinematales bacterium]|nr:extracellular solute-binding protein [Brevinematales bacterium]
MKKLLLVISVLMMGVSLGFSKVVINLWHAYRGAEADAINKVTEMFNLSHNDIEVKLLPVPFDAINNKLQTVIPAVNKGQSQEEGPDVFVFGQDFTGDWAERQLILPLENFISKDITSQYFKNTINAFADYMYDGALWALPGSFKNISLFYNKRFIANPPKKLSELMAISGKFTNPGDKKWGFSYDCGNFYYHTMWVQAWGGAIFKKIGTTKKGVPIFLPLLYSQPMISAGDFVFKNLKNGNFHGAAEAEITYSFNNNKTLFAISGQWFRGEIAANIDYGVAELPIVDEIGVQAVPFLTVEGYFMASCTKDQAAAAEVIKYFTSAAMGRYFGKIGKQTPANKGAYQYSEVKNDPISKVFMAAAGNAISMPNNPEMALTWDPASSGLSSVLNGANSAQTWKDQQIRLMKLIEKERKINYAKLGFDYTKFTVPLSIK